jgi:two-component system, OmpR family, alkaline phosphatase synthesis response regulator PhoP
MRVLIIDDEEDVRSVTSLALSAVGGMEVLEAAGGAEGFALAGKERPDAILLDVMMPGQNGIATLAQLRESEVTRAIPVVLLTAKAMSFELRRLEELGASGVITKPFDPMALADELRAILEKG